MHAVIVVAVLVAGCFQGAAPPPVVPAKSPPRTRIVANQDHLAFLPGDSQIVAVLDLDGLRRTALWPRVEARVRVLLRAMRSCETDPLARIRRISLGLRDLKNPVGTLVLRGAAAELKALHACLAQPATTELGHVVADLADPGTLVLRFGPANASLLTSPLDAGAPLRLNEELGELLARLDPDHPMWLAVADGRVFQGQTASLKATAMLVSARFGDPSIVQLRLRLDDLANATALATQFQQQLVPLAGMAEELTAVVEDLDLLVTVRMTKAQLDTLVGLLGPSLP